MKLFDARLSLGRQIGLEPFQFSDLPLIRKILDKYAVDRALLVSLASVALDFRSGNEEVFACARRDARLIPCPTVVPDSNGEVGPEDAWIRTLVKRGARCVGFYPKTYAISPDERVVGRLFAAIAKRRLPVLLSCHEMDTMAIAGLAARYARIPFLISPASYRDRNLMPVLRDLKNLYVGLGAGFAMNEGIEYLVRLIGAGRLVFSSNFPASEPGAAISYLCYADISRRDRERIAFHNLAGLVKGVRVE